MKYVIIFLLFTKAFACTIGLVQGSHTQNGKSLIFKTRDISSTNVTMYNNSFKYLFVGAGNSNFLFMGVNTKGFAIVNSLSQDLLTLNWNNSLTMRNALGTCKTLQNFEALLDSTNIVGRATAANYAVLDANGNVAMYEVSHNNYTKYTPNNGFIIRTNFALTGGGTNGVNRKNRAEAIIQGLINTNSVNVKNILQVFQRDFANQNLVKYDIPFLNYEDTQTPFAFINTSYSIARQTNGSSVCIEQVENNLDAKYTTMYTNLGYPVAGIAIPLMPCVNVPSITTNSNPAIFNANYAIKRILNNGDNNLLNTYLLKNENNTGLWQHSFTLEDSIITNFKSKKQAWVNNAPDSLQILELENYYASKTLNFLQNFNLDTNIIADFKAEQINNLTYRFISLSPNAPDAFWWDFDNDGSFDAYNNFASHTFNQEGTYTIKFKISKSNIFKQITKQINITKTNDVFKYVQKVKVFPNPFNPITKINFSLLKPCKVNINVYDIKGRKIKNIVSKTLKAKNYNYNINLKNQGSGIYFCKIKINNKTITKKIVLVK